MCGYSNLLHNAEGKISNGDLCILNSVLVIRLQLHFSKTQNALNITSLAQFMPTQFFFFMSQQPLLGQDLLIIEVSRSHSDTPHSVGIFCTSDRPDAETSTWLHTTLTTDRHPCLRPDSNPQSHQARGHLDRLYIHLQAEDSLMKNYTVCHLHSLGDTKERHEAVTKG